MNGDSVARVYSAALYEAANEADRVDAVRRDLGGLADALAESGALRSALYDPQIDLRTKERVMTEVAAHADPLVSNAVRLMLVKGRIGALADVRDEFERLAGQAERVIEVEAISAVALDEKTERQIAAQVEQATGRSVRLSSRVDPSIIGGLVLRVDDVVVDGSLKARIGQLRAQMQHAR